MIDVQAYTENRERLFCEHWPLIRKAARRFVRKGVDRADLEQVAALGLIKAMDRYDARLATPFAAYAWPLVLGELLHHVRDSERMMRIPRRVRELERRFAAAERELWVLLGREPHEREIGAYIQASPGDVREVREYRACSRIISFELLAGSEDRAVSREVESVLDKVVLDRALAALPPLEREIVEGIHLHGSSVLELARRLGYSRRHVTRMHRAALDRMRCMSHCKPDGVLVSS